MKKMTKKDKEKYYLYAVMGVLVHLRRMASANGIPDQIYMEAFLDNFIEIMKENKVTMKKAKVLIEAAYKAYEEENE